MSNEGSSSHLSRILSVLLRGGVILSAAFFALGLLALAIGHEPLDPGRYAHFAAPLTGSHFWPPMTSASDVLLHLGLLVLLLLPVARLVLAAALFAQERDWLFSAVSVVVLMLVALSTALARVE